MENAIGDDVIYTAKKAVSIVTCKPESRLETQGKRERAMVETKPGAER